MRLTSHTQSRSVAKRDRADDPADQTIAAVESSGAPPANTSIVPTQQLAPLGPDAVRVPDLTGMGARDAASAILGAGLVPEIEGSGRVSKQNPAAGSAAAKGSSVRLVFEPAS